MRHMKTTLQKQTDRETVQRLRLAHHRALETLRAEHCQLSGLQIWRRLSNIERLANAGACAYCNGENIRLVWPLFGPRNYDFAVDSSKAWEQLANVATDCVRNVLGTVPAGFFCNSDARGHTLKIDAEKTTIPTGLQTDWGSDGILAATIDNT
jgi:hypothetical protein